MENPAQVTYKGVVYKRNPASPDWPKRVYYRAGRGSGRGYLHRDIYADHHGPIPRGMHVHHKDHNPFNNDPSNLIAITPKEHRQEHGKKFDNERMEIFKATTLAAAAEWHRSEAGRAWHSEHGKRTWEGREPSVFTCPECGAEHEGHFPTRTGPERYCGTACRQRADRKSRKYFEEATCPICGSTFMQPKHYRERHVTCSRSCGAKMRWQNASAKRSDSRT